MNDSSINQPSPKVGDLPVNDLPKKPGRGSLLVIFLTIFIDLLGFGIVLPLLPIYADQFATDPGGWVIGLLMASFSIMQFIFAPIWGSLSDRIGRRPVIMIGLFGSVVFYTLFGIAAIYKSLPMLFLTRIGAGVSGATVATAQAYIADTTDNKNRSRGMALIGMAFGLGFTLGPLFAVFAVPMESPELGTSKAIDKVAVVQSDSEVQSAADSIGQSKSLVANAEAAAEADPGPGPGFVAAGLSAIALLLAIFLLPESRIPGKSASAVKKWWDLSRWQIAFSSPAIMLLLGAFFVCIFSFANFETTLSMLLKGSKDFPDAPFNFSFHNICYMFALIGFLSAFVQGGVVRPLAKRISEPKLAIAGAMFEVVGFAILTYAITFADPDKILTWLFVALVVIVLGYGFLQPNLYALLSRWSDPEKQGVTLGVGQSVNAMARILGSALGIPMLKATLFLPYLAASFLMIFVAVFVFFAAKHGRDYSPEK